MTTIIPSILTFSEEIFQQNVESVQDIVPMVQIDLTDGVFAPTTTWAWQHPIKAQTHIATDFELHLMVKDPVETLTAWQQNPRLKRLMIHYESSDHIENILKKTKPLGKELYLVLNPDTNVDVIRPYTDTIHGVMFMGVYPGKQGQEFLPETLNRIRNTRNTFPSLPIEVDGGVNETTIADIIRAGATAVCPGSAVFGNHHSAKDNLAHLRILIDQASAL